MMKKNKLLKTLLLLMVMLVGSATNVLGQTTLFLWQSDGSTTALETALTATGGTAAFYGSAVPGTESAAYNEMVTDNDLKATGSKGHKLGTNTLYLKITLTGGNKLQEGDIIYICGYKPFRVGTGVTSDRANTDLASNLATGTSKTDYNVGSVTVPSTIGNNVTEIYLSRAEGTGTGLAAVKIVRPAVTTDPVITASDASITATKSGVAVTKDVVVTGANLTGSTLTATLSPAVEGLSVSLASNTIADGAISTTATLSYTATENASGTTTLTLSDGTTSKEVTITYTAKVVATELQAISEGTTWDFGTDVSGSKQFTTDEDKNTEYVYADIAELTFNTTFKADALAFKGEYPFRDSSHKYAQNGILHFKTTVPGTITVKFSDTGTSASATAVKRYLVVNDEQTEYWASRENNGTDNPYAAQLNVETGEISVPAGDVTITGSSAITVSKIVFTPATAIVAVTGVTLDKTTAEVEVGKTVTLAATVAPENATIKNVTWESDNTKVATVDEDGVVTGVAEGTANITVTTEDGSFTDICAVTVKEATPEETPLVTLPTETRDGYGCTGSRETASYSGNVYNGQTVYLIESGKSITLTVPAYTVVSKIRVSGTSNDNKASTVTITGANTESISSDFANRKSSTATDLDFVPTTQTTTYTISSSNKGSWVIIKVYGEETNEATVTVSPVGYATFSSSKAFDFSESGITVYTAKANGTSVTLTEVEDGIVPANTGVVLYAAGGASATVSVATTTKTTLEDNEMVANVVLAKVYLEGDNNKTNYILSNEDAGVGFYLAASGGAYLPANRAYLSTTATGTDNAPFLGFDGNETTGINSVERGALSVEGCYTLDGRRVAQPTKGLYIVNGRKVIIK